MARPISTSYSDEERQRIIEHVLGECAAGRAVSRILAEDDGMPAASCFWGWHYKDEQLQENLARAREHGASVHLDEALTIADTPVEGETHTIERIKPADMDLNDLIDDGPQDLVKTTRADMLGHRKLQIETRIKVAQMIAPRKYGPKLDLTSGGEKLGIAEAIAAGRKRVIDAQKGEE
jgi:hypothetical protein